MHKNTKKEKAAAVKKLQINVKVNSKNEERVMIRSDIKKTRRRVMQFYFLFLFLLRKFLTPKRVLIHFSWTCCSLQQSLQTFLPRLSAEDLLQLINHLKAAFYAWVKYAHTHTYTHTSNSPVKTFENIFMPTSQLLLRLCKNSETLNIHKLISDRIGHKRRGTFIYSLLS